MKLGIDISQIVYKGTGVARFTSGLVNAILDFDKTNNWLFFFSSFRRSLDREIENKILKKGHKLIKWKLPPTCLSFLWNDLHNFSKILNSKFFILNSLDWFITSDWTEPPLNVKKATIVHDLAYLRYPETVDNKIITTQKKRINRVKKESNIIFADSNSTKQDLVNLLKFDENKIKLNYPGVTVSKPSKEQINLTLKKYFLKRPFILSVGVIEPRKNINRLIGAFSKLNYSNIDLLIVGPPGWDDLKQFNNLTMKQLNIRFLGLISDLDLYSLYSSCLFFIYPSIWEGFGYPILEAMKLGAPVATSNTSSLAEIAKDNALLFNPFSVEEIFGCLKNLIENKPLRDKLTQKGLEKSKIFTWKLYLDKMLKILSTN